VRVSLRESIRSKRKKKQLEEEASRPELAKMAEKERSKEEIFLKYSKAR
jgi:hypothetical protein